jgi:hypothetical protein
MNIYTKEIAAVANVTIENAKQIQDYIEEEIGIDYSECSSAQFAKTVRQAVKEMQAA